MSLGVLKEFCVNSKKTFKGTRKIKLLEGMEDSCFSVTRDNSANQLFYTKYLIACHLPCFIWAINFKREMVKKIFLIMEESGIEPETFRMRSGRSTTELHPHCTTTFPKERRILSLLSAAASHSYSAKAEYFSYDPFVSF